MKKKMTFALALILATPLFIGGCPMSYETLVEINAARKVYCDKFAGNEKRKEALEKLKEKLDVIPESGVCPEYPGESGEGA